jgi:hypothetical protein
MLRSKNKSILPIRRPPLGHKFSDEVPSALLFEQQQRPQHGHAFVYR